MSEPNWFQRKWGILEQTPVDTLFKKIKELEKKYNSLLLDIKRLEEENVELTNSLYEIENRLQAKIDNIHPVIYNLKNYTLDK